MYNHLYYFVWSLLFICSKFCFITILKLHFTVVLACASRNIELTRGPAQKIKGLNTYIVLNMWFKLNKVFNVYFKNMIL